MPLTGEQVQALILQLLAMQVTVSSIGLATVSFVVTYVLTARQEQSQPGSVPRRKRSSVFFSNVRVLILTGIGYSIILPIFEIAIYFGRVYSDTIIVTIFTLFLGLSLAIFSIPIWYAFWTLGDS
jgi:hypothetical protein